MVKTLVVPLDGSPETERAAPIAAALARQWNAELVLVAVSSLPERARRDLEQLMWRGGFEGRVEVIDQDDVVAALRNVVEQAPEPAVCMATHSRGRVSVALLGSVTERLLREVHVPFVLVGPHCATGWPTGSRRLVACVDESSTSEAIIEPAAQWAKRLGLELWLTEVFHPLDLGAAEAPYRLLDRVVERLRPELPGVKVSVAWSDHVPGEILHLADTLDASMVAMGTHGRSALPRVALGSVTMQVTHRAPCPVLTVRPAHLEGEEGAA
jgi:nucleotide-binding universal stress UspA family protein